MLLNDIKTERKRKLRKRKRVIEVAKTLRQRSSEKKIINRTKDKYFFKLHYKFDIQFDVEKMAKFWKTWLFLIIF